MSHVRTNRWAPRLLWVPLLWAAFFCWSAPAQAAAAVSTAGFQESVDVSMSSGYVKLGERLGIVIRISSSGKAPGRLTNVKVGSVEGLNMGEVTGPSETSRFESDSRNRMVSSFTSTYVIPVTPAAVGDYVIEPLELTIGGRKVTAPLKPMTLRVLKDIEGSRVIALDFEPLPKRVFEGEPYTVDMTLGWASSLNVGGVMLQVPWWGRQDGVIQLEPQLRGDEREFPIDRGGKAELLVQDLGRRDRDGDTFQLYRLERRFVATRPGKVAFSRTVMEVTRGNGRSRRTFYQVVPDFEVEVVPVPEAGRPLDWTGAIGDIRVDREVPRRDIDAGDTISFEVSYSGNGNLEFFDPPNLERVPGFERFRVLGVTDNKQPFLRLITYELVPMGADVDEVPAVPLSVFNVETEKYETVSTEPVKIRVTASASGEDPFEGMDDPTPEEEKTLAPLDILPRPVLGSGQGFLSRGPGPWAGFLALVGALGGWVVLRRAVRRRGDPDSVEARRRRAAMGSLRRDLSKASGEAERAAALERFLAARTGTSPEAWIGRSSLAGITVEGDDTTARELDAALSQLRDGLDRPVFGRADVRGGDAGASTDAILEFAKLAVQGGL